MTFVSALIGAVCAYIAGRLHGQAIRDEFFISLDKFAELSNQAEQTPIGDAVAQEMGIDDV